MYNRQLDSFVRVVDAGSFNKAARDLYITPVSLIQQVNLLEERLRQVEDPNLYRKMKKLDRDARLMIHDLKNMKLLNREE